MCQSHAESFMPRHPTRSLAHSFTRPLTHLLTRSLTHVHVQGATNNALRNADGKCVDPVINHLKLGPTDPWPTEAAAIVANAGRRSGKDLVRPTVPPLSPPVPPGPAGLPSCIRFGIQPCVVGKKSQQWLLSAGVKPGDGKYTTVQSADATGSGGRDGGSCMATQVAPLKKSCNANNHGTVDCVQDCKPLPSPGTTDPCALYQAWQFFANGTIQNGGLQNVTNHARTGTDKYFVCLTSHQQGAGKPAAVNSFNCSTDPKIAATQKWIATANSDGSITIKQNGLCLDNNFAKSPNTSTTPAWL